MEEMWFDFYLHRKDQNGSVSYLLSAEVKRMFYYVVKIALRMNH